MIREITEEQIKQSANEYISEAKRLAPNLNNFELECLEAGVRSGLRRGVKLAQGILPQWTTIDIEDTETLPNDFEPVLCWTTDNNLQMLMLMKYGDAYENAEWETNGLKPNKAFKADYVIKWIFIDDPKA